MYVTDIKIVFVATDSKDLISNLTKRLKEVSC